MINIKENFADYWQKYLNTCLRPSLEDLAIYEKSIINNFPKNSRVLIIGFSPELRELCERNNLTVVCLGDDENEFIQTKQLMDKIGKEEFILTDWISGLEKNEEKFDLIISDISLNFLSKNISINLVKDIEKLLSDSGKLIIRNLIRQTNDNETNIENIFASFKSTYPELLPTQSCFHEILLSKYDYEQEQVELNGVFSEVKSNYESGKIEEAEFIDFQDKNWQNLNLKFYIPLEDDFYSNFSMLGLQLLAKELGNDFYSNKNPIYIFEKIKPFEIVEEKESVPVMDTRQEEKEDQENKDNEISIDPWLKEELVKLIDKTTKDLPDPKILLLADNLETIKILEEKNLKYSVLTKEIVYKENLPFSLGAEFKRLGAEFNRTNIVGDFLEMPFVDNSFDLVIGSDIVNILDFNELPKFFLEIKRVLSPLGMAIINPCVANKNLQKKDIDQIVNEYRQTKNEKDLILSSLLYSNIVSHKDENSKSYNISAFKKEIEDLAIKGIITQEELQIFENKNLPEKMTFCEDEQIQQLLFSIFNNFETIINKEEFYLQSNPIFLAKKASEKKEVWQKMAEIWANFGKPIKLSELETQYFEKSIQELIKAKENIKILILGSHPEIRNLALKNIENKKAEIILLDPNRNAYLASSSFIEHDNSSEKFIEAKFLEMDFIDESFDLIIGDNIFNFYSKEEWEIIIKKLAKTLKQGGKFLFRRYDFKKIDLAENFVETAVKKYTVLYEQNELFLSDAAAYLYFELLQFSFLSKQNKKYSFSYIADMVNNYKDNIINFNEKLLLDSLQDCFGNDFNNIYQGLLESEFDEILKPYFETNEKIKSNNFIDLINLYQIHMADTNVKKPLDANEKKAVAKKILAPTVLELEIHKKNFLEHVKGVQSPKMLVLGANTEISKLGLSLGFEVTAVDYNPKEFEQINDLQKEKIILGNWLDVELPSDYYDVVIGNLPFNYLKFDKYAKLFKKLRAVLKESGCLTIKNLVMPDISAEKSFDDYFQDYKNGIISAKEFYVLCKFYLMSDIAYDSLNKEISSKKIREKLLSLKNSEQISNEEFLELSEFDDELEYTILKETEFKNLMENYFQNTKVGNTVEKEYDKFLVEIFYATPKKKKIKENLLLEESMKNWKYFTEPYLISQGDIYNYDKLIKKVLEKKQSPKILLLGSSPELRDLLYKYKFTNNAQVICLDLNEKTYNNLSEFLNFKNSQELYLKMDWLSLPFEDNSIDLVVGDLVSSKVEVKSKQKLYLEIQRVLKDGSGFISREAVIIENIHANTSFEQELNKYHDLLLAGEISLKQAFNWTAFNLICSSWYFNQDDKCSLSYFEPEIERFDKKINTGEEKQGLLKEIYRLLIQYWYPQKEKVWNFTLKEELEKQLISYFHIKDILYANDYLNSAAMPLYLLQPVKSYAYDSSQTRKDEVLPGSEYIFEATKPELEIFEKYLKEAISFNDKPEVLILGAAPALRDLALKNNCQTMAIDISDKTLQKMNEQMEYKDSEKNYYMKGNWLLMDQFLRHNAYDVILGDSCLNLLNEVDQTQLLGILKKLLKPGGKLILRNLIVSETKQTQEIALIQQDYDNGQLNLVMFLLSLALYSPWKEKVLDINSKKINFIKLFELVDEALNSGFVKLQQTDLGNYAEIKKTCLQTTYQVFNLKDFEELVRKNYLIVNKDISGWKFSESAPIYYLGQI